MQISAGVQADHKIRLSGKGIPRVSGYGYGDHYIHIKIKVPKYDILKRHCIHNVFFIRILLKHVYKSLEFMVVYLILLIQ